MSGVQQRKCQKWQPVDCEMKDLKTGDVFSLSNEDPNALSLFICEKEDAVQNLKGAWTITASHLIKNPNYKGAEPDATEPKP